jgi:hypothetical protein
MSADSKPATIADVTNAAETLWHECRSNAEAVKVLGRALADGDIDEEAYAESIKQSRAVARDSIVPLVDTLLGVLRAYVRQEPIKEAATARPMRLADTIGGTLVR